MTGWDEFKESDVVREDNWRIAKETSESPYTWDIEKSGKTEIVDNSNSVE